MYKIITVYDSLNPGSYLQATALYNILKTNYGNNISFLNIGARHPFLSAIKLSCKLILKFKFNCALKQLKMPFEYHKTLKNYKKTKMINSNDIYILGSDEIWNISREKIIKHKEFFGLGLNVKRCISYAPSINNSKEEDFNKYEYIKESLKKIKYISVRDRYSKDIIEKITNKKAILVCDPTILVDINQYKKVQSQQKYSDYILVYGSPKRFSWEMINEIKELAFKKNKKLISYYFNNEWCDSIVYGSPMDFLALIDNAEYIITNTFHGTIFSILYNKKFVANSQNNTKVHELLKEFNLDVEYSKEKSITDILNSKYDYDRINNEIDTMRKIGKEFLTSSIEKIRQQQ